MVYNPSEDSYILEKEIIDYLSKLNKKDLKKIKVLDMGSGSGIQAESCIKSGVLKENLFLVDLDLDSYNLLKKNKSFLKENLFLSDLFSEIPKTEKYLFDLIIFNTPYLPEDKEGYDSEIDTTGGKKGYEVTLRFLKQAKDFLKDFGVIILLISSNTNKPKVTEFLLGNNYKISEIKEFNEFFEKIYVLKITKESFYGY